MIGAVLDERKPDYRFLKVVRELAGEIPELLYYHIDLPIPTEGDENDHFESQRTQLGAYRPR